MAEAIPASVSAVMRKAAGPPTTVSGAPSTSADLEAALHLIAGIGEERFEEPVV